MTITLSGNNGSGVSNFIITELPDRCPYCHKSIRPTPIYGFQYDGKWSVLMNCPDRSCRESFIAYYQVFISKVGVNQTAEYLHKTSIGNLEVRIFSKEILGISEQFTEIYNESFAAEQQGLLEICGVGYRKSLEFLIKDYAIKNHPGEKEEIDKLLLGPCVDKYVSDERTKTTAKRAVWIGNDETHFIRKWEGKTLIDLKNLIDLTLHWIQTEILTQNFSDEMPAPTSHGKGYKQTQ